MKKRAIEQAIENGQRSGAGAESGGPAPDDHSAAAESYRAWVRLGKPKGGITKEPPETRGKVKRPRYNKAKSKLDAITADETLSELKKKREELKKKYPKK